MSGRRAKQLRRYATHLVMTGQVPAKNVYQVSWSPRTGNGTLRASGWRRAYQDLKQHHARGVATPADERARKRMLAEVNHRARRKAAAKRRRERRAAASAGEA